ncbi:hypothetical protein [uncultured Enterovirga sp.]|uniref:alginate O-acetyltransferase AlgX-related protein n=1 Tax=uncultured Enterovirga sp. TaxID=2026352 RepID=UPI0035CAA915
MQVSPSRQPRAIHVGRDGWLFLTGGSNAALSQYRATLGRWRRLRAWSRLIEHRADRARAARIRYLHMVVPEKLTVYPHLCATPLVDPGQSPALRLAAAVAARGRPRLVLDLVPPMLSAGRNQALYWRTDTHWTLAGCLVAYRELCRALGATPQGGFTDRPFLETDSLLDLGSKMIPPVPEPYRVYGLQRDAVRTFANEIVTDYEEGRAPVSPHTAVHVVYTNPSAEADPRRLLLYGDSCAHYHPFRLTALLAETFREVHFVWSASVDWEHVASVKPDLLVTEIAERFLARVPDDGFDLAAETRRRAEAARAGIETAPV